MHKYTNWTNYIIAQTHYVVVKVIQMEGTNLQTS